MVTETKPSKFALIIALIVVAVLVSAGYFAFVSGEEHLPSKHIFENTQTINIL